MKVVGLCHICSGPAMNTCMSCGRSVCELHFNPDIGICNACSRKTVKLPKRKGDVEILK